MLDLMTDLEITDTLLRMVAEYLCMRMAHRYIARQVVCSSTIHICLLLYSCLLVKIVLYEFIYYNHS